MDALLPAVLAKAFASELCPLLTSPRSVGLDTLRTGFVSLPEVYTMPISWTEYPERVEKFGDLFSIFETFEHDTRANLIDSASCEKETDDSAYTVEFVGGARIIPCPGRIPGWHQLATLVEREFGSESSVHHLRALRGRASEVLDVPIGAVNYLTILQVVAALDEANRGPTTTAEASDFLLAEYRWLKVTQIARVFAMNAGRVKVTHTNPFADVAAQSTVPVERKAYITVEDTEQIITVCNPTWRLIIALAPYGGLRCPSEVLSLKWSDVNFEAERMTVPSCKTEHIPGKAYRIVPIFANLKPHLDEAFELAVDGAEYVVPGEHLKAALKPSGWMNCNLRTQFLKIIRRAGLQPWPRLFHNLRASCETDLMASHPIHVVTGWLGNTPIVAMKHYLQVLDTDFEMATRGGVVSGAVEVQKAVQSGTTETCLETTWTPQPQTIVGLGRPLSSSITCSRNSQVGDTGFEPVTSSV